MSHLPIQRILSLLPLGLCLFLTGCATEPNLSDLKKQVQTLVEQQSDFQKREQQYLNRIETLESQVDEHDFLVGELIKTEEEASLDTRNLLDKLERTSSRLHEQIGQTRTSTSRRDQDLSIRAKALEARIDNLLQRQRLPASAPVSPSDKVGSVEPDQAKSSQAASAPGRTASPNNQAAVFRSAYKVYLNGQYERAAVEFHRFLAQYPSAALTPQAYYYLGDSHYIQKNYDPAAEALQQVISDYPESKYVPAALIKLGLVMKESNEQTKAKQYWDQVINKFPNSSEASAAKEQIAKLP